MAEAALVQLYALFQLLSYYSYGDCDSQSYSYNQFSMRDPQKVYQRQAVANASPVQLVVKLYDLLLQATWREDGKKVREILSTLITGLNFDHEPADQLFSLYRYCQDLSRKGEFEEIREILEPLRDTWSEVAHGAPSEEPEA